MAMTIEQIDRWKDDRLKKRNGEWVSDVIFCISCAMEDCSPCYGRWERNPTVSWSYIRLVEIGCEYLKDKRSVSETEKFLEEVFKSPVGIGFLKDSQKRRFAEQLAWMLNLPDLRSSVEEAIATYGARTPDSGTIASDWNAAKKEYKRRIR